ncbi:MAG: general secretion pathway protein GspE, partial [Planctomycetales bacterium]
MSEQFDAYYKWLGVPPQHQPPNHYRLMSIELFEDNADIIDGAADRAMNFVRAFQSGKHSETSQKILNELS